jgi:methyl-accepting chemotaxis protein
MKFLKLGTKLLIGGLLAVAIPIIVIGIVSVYQATESTFKDKNEDMIIISESLAGALEIGMSEQLLAIRTISLSNSVIAAAEKVAKEGEAKSRQEMALAEKELIKIKKTEGDRLSSINLVDKNGIFYVSSDVKAMKGVNVAARGYFKTALKGTPNVGSVNISSATGRVVCSNASPIYSPSGKDITGVVMMSFTIKIISDIFDKMKIGKAGYAYIVDKNGLYINHPVKEKILKENIFQIQGMEAVAELVKQGKPGITKYKLDGVGEVAAVSPVAITGWSVVSTIPVDELYAPARFTRNMIIAVGMIFLILASVFFYFFARSLTVPLVNVVEAAQKIAGGDLTVEVTSNARQDEIGTLARAFTLMIQSLK